MTNADYKRERKIPSISTLADGTVLVVVQVNIGGRYHSKIATDLGVYTLRQAQALKVARQLAKAREEGFTGLRVKIARGKSGAYLVAPSLA